MWTDLLSVLSEARLTDQIAHRQECLCHTAAERLQRIARGESEANTPRKRSRRRNRAASAAPERLARPALLPLTRQKFFHIHGRRVIATLSPLAIFRSRSAANNGYREYASMIRSIAFLHTRQKPTSSRV